VKQINAVQDESAKKLPPQHIMGLCLRKSPHELNAAAVITKSPTNSVAAAASTLIYQKNYVDGNSGNSGGNASLSALLTMNNGIGVNVYLSQKAEIYWTRTNGSASCRWMSAQRFSAQSWSNEPSNFLTSQAPISNLVACQNLSVEMACSYSKQCSIYEKNHNLPSRVAFVDLVKAYDTANHNIILDILERYGAPPSFVAAIGRTYQDLIVVLKIEKEVVELSQTVGVWQGDNMAPVLFLFLMSAFAETLEVAWKEAGIDVCTVQ
jgi:hypothetical protein